MNTKPQIIKISQQLAKLSAIIGTSIFAFFIITRINETLLFGLTYILIAATLNGIFLIALAIYLFHHREQWRNIVATMIFMMANIPLSIFYSLIAFKFL